MVTLDNDLVVWEPSESALTNIANILEDLPPNRRPPTDLSFSPDGQTIAIARQGHRTISIRRRDGSFVSEFEGHSQVKFTPRGNHVVTSAGKACWLFGIGEMVLGLQLLPRPMSLIRRCWRWSFLDTEPCSQPATEDLLEKYVCGESKAKQFICSTNLTVGIQLKTSASLPTGNGSSPRRYRRSAPSRHHACDEAAGHWQRARRRHHT